MNHNEEQSSGFRNSDYESRSDGGDNLSLVQFLYMEFFGAFLPGVTAVGSVLVIISHAAKNYGLIDVLFLKSMINRGLWPYGFVLLLFLAYSVGVIVYRRPHEEPDAASCFRIVCRNHRRHTRCNDRAFRYDDKRPLTSTARLLRPPLILLFNEWMWRLRTGRSEDESFHAERRHRVNRSENRLAFREIRLNAGSARRRRKWRKQDSNSFGSLFRSIMEHCDFFIRPERAWYWKSERSKSISLNSASYRMDCSYPYPLYRRYLYMRDADHLAKYVTWCAGSDNPDKKSPKGKLFVNTLKQRIRAFAPPELVRDMVRNEAHVRTLSSLWFILRFLVRFIIGTNILFAVAGTIPTWTHFATTVLLLWLVWYLKYIIETGFHYVRVRELNMVLETADIIQTQLSCSGGKAPFSDFLAKGRTVCSTCSRNGASAGSSFCEECFCARKTKDRATNEPGVRGA